MKYCALLQTTDSLYVRYVYDGTATTDKVIQSPCPLLYLVLTRRPGSTLTIASHDELRTGGMVTKIYLAIGKALIGAGCSKIAVLEIDIVSRTAWTPAFLGIAFQMIRILGE